MSPKEIFSQLSLWIVNFYPKSGIFCRHFNLYLQFACVDPDPYSEYGSGPRKLLNTDLIRIRIHNTDLHHCG